MTEIAEPKGWIAPAERTKAQRAIDDIFAYQNETFADVSEGDVDLPEKALFYDLEMKAIGRLAPRVWQQSGSCVGSAANHSYITAICGDIVIRGDQEEVKMIWMMGAYGRGRYLGGMRSKGEGSFGSIQAKAAQQGEFGLLPYDDLRVPQPKFSKDSAGGTWAKWTKEQEIEWSYSPQWPCKYETLRQDAAAFGFAKETRVKTVYEYQQCSAQGYGLCIAANSLQSGKVKPQNDGLLISDFRGSGGHQQGLGGYWKHPEHWLLILVLNQWNDCHGHDSFLYPLGITGAYWIREARFQELLSMQSTEVTAVTASGGWPKKEIVWDDIFQYE